MENDNLFDNAGNFFEDTLNKINEISESTIADINSYIEELPSKIDTTFENLSQSLDLVISDFQSEIVKPISLEFKKISEELDIKEEKEAIYKALNISSDEEFIEIICFLAAAGVSVSVFVFVLSYLEGGIPLSLSLPFFRFCDDINGRSKLENDRLQQIGFLLRELDKQKYFTNNLYLENIRLNGLYQESIRIRPGANNQYFIDRKIINADNKQLSVSDNLLAPLLITSFIEALMKGDINMNQIKQKGNFGIGQMNSGTLSGNTKIAGVINEPEQQTLSEAAQEIQKLLEQLSENYPTNTNREKITVVMKAVDQIEDNPTLKSKVINALNVGGSEAFKEVVDHPLINILVATIEGYE